MAATVFDELPSDLRRLTRAEYDELVELGWWEGEPYELLEGALVYMSPEGPNHAWFINSLAELLEEAFGRAFQVRRGNPFVAGDLSEPEPDIAVVPRDDYRKEHPSTAALLVEVSHSSRRKDTVTKPRIYAQAGVPEYWVVDLVDDVVIRYLDPSDGGYAMVTRHTFDEALPVAGTTIRVADAA